MMIFIKLNEHLVVYLMMMIFIMVKYMRYLMF
jgi:hypothetical protein